MKGVATDLSYINTPTTIKYYEKDDLYNAMNSDIIVVVAGFPRKEGMSRADLLSKNAQIIYNLVGIYSKIVKSKYFGKEPYLCIATNPVNSLLPIVRLTCMELNIWERVKNKVIGITYLDTIRLKTITNNLDDNNTFVVGGHSKDSMVPISNSITPYIESELKNAGANVIAAYESRGSATLSMAYSTLEFIKCLIKKENCIGMVWVEHRFISTKLTFDDSIGENVKLPEEVDNELLKSQILAQKWWNDCLES